MQKIFLIGNIGKDAEIREAGNSNTVISFNVAVTEKWKDKQGNPQSKTTWFQCSYWLNNTTIAQYLKKGTKVYVEGKPNASAYTNNQNEIVVQEGINVIYLELLSSNNDVQKKPYNKAGDEFLDKEDDLPF